MPTIRLYYTDSYLTAFDATVTDQGDGGRSIYLDRTAFYPTSGGQPFDTGTLNGIQVTDVVDEGDRIAHRLAEPLHATEVKGQVDWTRRHDFMQQHTGQHLLSAVIAERLGHATASVHFGDESSTLDLAVAAITPEVLRQAELWANEVVMENRGVSASTEEAATATGLRKVPERSGPLRIVTIERLDRSACGGTHVWATGEIGPLLIRKAERVKQQVRLEFLCGGRAVRRARADFELLSGMAVEASVGIDEVPATVSKLRTELKTGLAERRTLQEQLHFYRAAALHHAASPDTRGWRHLVIGNDLKGVEELRGLAAAAIALPGTIVSGCLAEPPTLLLATSADTGLDAGATLKPVLAALGGRGGGNARIAQGSLPATAPAGLALTQLAGAIERISSGTGLG